MSESNEIHRPMYNIFEPEYEDISTDWYQYIPYYDTNLNSPNSVPDFRIDINDRDSYFHPHKSYVEFSFNIINSNNNPFTTDAITIQNGIMGALTKRCEFMFDDTLCDYVDNPDISLTVQNLIYFSDDYNKTASQMLWYLDSVDNPTVDVTVPAVASISVGNIPFNTISFFDVTAGLPATFTVDAAGLLTAVVGIGNGTAADVITASITINAIVYPIQFFSINNTNGIMRATDTNLTLIASAGINKLAFNSGASAANDSIIAMVQTYASPVTFLSNTIPVILSLDAGLHIVLNHALNPGVGNAFTGVVVPSGISQAGAQTLQLYNNYSETVNTGMRKRWMITQNSTVITVQVPLKHIFGLFRSYDKITKGIKMSLRLTKNTYNNIFLAAVGVANGQLVIANNGIKWWMPRLDPNKSVLPMITHRLNNIENHRVSFTDVQVFRSPLYAAPVTNQIYQVRTKRQRPLKVHICFQIDDPNNINNFVAYNAATSNIGPFANTARISGPQTQNKRIFDHINLTKLRCVVNGTTQYPEQEYNIAFPTIPTVATPAPTNLVGNWARVYSEFLRCGLRDHGIDEGVTVSYDMFKSLYPIFSIDLTEKPERFVNVESALIEIYWSNTYVSNYYMWVIIESEKSLEMSVNKDQMKILKVNN